MSQPTISHFPARDVQFDREVTALVSALERQLEPTPSPPSRTISIVADDGVSLAADVFVPEGPARARLLFAPAMGVRRQFYGRFLAHLAAHGVASLVLDYRGVAGSRDGHVRSVEASLSDWGERDLAAATRALVELDLETTGARVPNLFMGHSVGGQLFGLMRDVPFDAAYLVGSQAGYWRNWAGLKRVGIMALWFGAIPLFTSTLGYLPMKAFGQGEDIPAGVARQWAEWGRDPSYVGVRASQIPDAAYSTWRGRLRAVAIADDGYAPERAVHQLVRLYEAAEGEVVVIGPDEIGARSIGHFGWFHPRFRDSLWADARAFLLGD
jgi:predicted alpha/beta hydrolase